MLTRLKGGPGTAPGGIGITIAQGNIDLDSQWRRAFYGQNLDVYLRLTDRALRASHPALVIWPESAMTFFLENLARFERGEALENVVDKDEQY